jgi:hypothetical protein
MFEDWDDRGARFDMLVADRSWDAHQCLCS